MATVHSGQIGVRILQLKTIAETDEVIAIANEQRYSSSEGDGPSEGWGSINQTNEILALDLRANFSATHIQRSDSRALRSNDAFSIRCYWWMRDPSRVRKFGDAADRRDTHRLQSCDLVFFPEEDGYSVIVTDRDLGIYDSVVQLLGRLIRSIDAKARIYSETNSQHVSEDVFLWLLFRLQASCHLSPNLFLASLNEIYSRDRVHRGARFVDEASVERIELAALVATGTATFGPAKMTLLLTNPDASFDFELFPDGGFRPYRRSHYTDLPVSGLQQALMLIEDIWAVVLPEMRSAYSADSTWFSSGRLSLRRDAHMKAIELLGKSP